MSSRRIALAALALAPLIASGIGGARAASRRVTIAVGGKAALFYLPLTLAERLGYFRDEGLDVQILDFPGGAKSLQAMMGGSADVVSGGFDHVIILRAKGQASSPSSCRSPPRRWHWGCARAAPHAIAPRQISRE